MVARTVRAVAVFVRAFMKPRKPSIKRIASLCAEPGPDDGLDPRFDERPTRSRATRKALQLCTTATQTLQSVLAGECGDDTLRDLTVLAVEPAPHAGRLLVTVRCADREHVSPEDVLDRVQRVAGMLRSELAAAVNRRRAPELVFRVAL